MALKLLYEGNGNPEARPVSRLEVYRLREAFLRTSPAVLTHRHGRDLGPDAPLLLTETMQLTAYRATGGVPGIWQRMAGYLGRGARFGAMFADLVRGSGHWAAVLGVRGSGTRQEFRIYDPSWATRNLDWLPAAQAARTYAGIQLIVSAAVP
jgi:hypothetical protein